MTRAILFVAASPVGPEPLPLGEEARGIQLALDRAGRGGFALVTRWAVRPHDLLRELRTHRPAVVHFSGHGRGTGSDPRADATAPRDALAATDGGESHGLYFQGPDGRAQLVSPAALSEAFRDAGRPVKLVVLNACYSEPLARALLAHVPCVIGMRGSIGDRAACRFAAAFYDALGARASLAAAFADGCAAIGLDGLGDADRPQLLVAAATAADRLVLARPRRARFAAMAGVAAIALASAGATLALHRRASDSSPRPADPDMVRLDGGVFQMGSSPAEIAAAIADCDRELVRTNSSRGCNGAAFEREAPVRTVVLSPFDIDRTEVSNAAFAGWLNTLPAVAVTDTPDGRYVTSGGVDLIDLAVSEITRAEPPAGPASFTARGGAERHPAAGVSPIAAQRYCEAQRKRLPTEAEWEYAARGAARRRFPWGDTPQPDELGCRIVIAYLGDPRCPDPRSVVDVGSSPGDVTPEGVHDLAGNVAEWVADAFAERYPACGSCRDPVVAQGTEHVFRGGSHRYDTGAARGAARSKSAPLPASSIGFRCARSR